MEKLQNTGMSWKPLLQKKHGRMRMANSNVTIDITFFMQ